MAAQTLALPFAAALLLIGAPAVGSVGPLDLTGTVTGTFALIVFAVAYLLVMLEEKLSLRKSKPVLVAAGIIWGAVGWVYIQQGVTGAVEEA